MEYKFYIDEFINISSSMMIYLLYIELNPKIGGIWLRRDSFNKLVLSLDSLYHFLIYPLKEFRMWLPSMWDANVFVSVPTIYFILKQII